MTKKASLMKILSVQKNCWRCIYAIDNNKFLSINDLIELEIAKFGWKLKNNFLPVSLQKCADLSHSRISLKKVHRYHTRNKMIPNVPVVKNLQYKSSIFCKSITLMDKLPSHLNNQTSYKAFCFNFKNFLKA